MTQSSQTSTFTHTYTRLEALEDQFEHFLRFGGISDDIIVTVRSGVREKKVHSAGLYACNAAGLRILEVSLSIDWATQGRLTIQQPYLSLKLTGWEGTMSPEVKVAGRRFSETASELGATPRCWVSWLRPEWAQQYGFSGTVPGWSGVVEERSDSLLDLPEASIFIRTSR